MSSNHKIPNATHELLPETSDRLTRPFIRFANLASSGGIVLLLCTVAALVWSNSESLGESYHKLFHETDFEIGIGSFVMHDHLLHWINDGLMAIFFLLVGLEIKREVLVGELSDPKRAALPIIGAIGGMIVPALIYAAFNYDNPDTIRGWGVPMATDIAFALGILALLGSRVPNSLKVFLASLAIADDLGALLVIAIFYTDQLDLAMLGMAGAVLAVLVSFNMMGFRRAIFYIIPGLFLWYFVKESQVHATIAGVLLACTIPVSSRVDGRRYVRYTREAIDTFEDHLESGSGPADIDDRQRAAVIAIEKNNHLVVPLLNRMEHLLHPWVAFAIIPVFALGNAGVVMHGSLGDAVWNDVATGVILGLFLGKPIGVAGLSFLAIWLGWAKLPSGVTRRHIVGAGFLAGIGFTMAIFIANLAYTGEHAAVNLQHAKIGILVASFAASVVGLLILITSPRKTAQKAEDLEAKELGGGSA